MRVGQNSSTLFSISDWSEIDALHSKDVDSLSEVSYKSRSLHPAYAIFNLYAATFTISNFYL